MSVRALRGLSRNAHPNRSSRQLDRAVNHRGAGRDIDTVQRVWRWLILACVLLGEAACSGASKAPSPNESPPAWVFEGPLSCGSSYECKSAGPSDTTLEARLVFIRTSSGRCRSDAGAYVDGTYLRRESDDRIVGRIVHRERDHVPVPPNSWWCSSLP
jgi:hypothetical protein